MKKLLSILLVLVMALSLFACNKEKQPDNPTQPETQESQKQEESKWEGLALQLKNKTGVVIDKVFIYPEGGERGNSVVEPGWPDKDMDGFMYELFIYIVRENGKPMEVAVVFADGSEAVWKVGELNTNEELSFKKGKDPAQWEHSALEKEEDIHQANLLAAAGKTDDNFYPGYELIAVEFKNKTGKGIKEMYFYEKGGDPKNYNNVLDYLYSPEGAKVDVLGSGKTKEGGMYLFKCFIRPHSDSYMIDVVFDDGTKLTYPIDDWFKADGSGHLPNEISLKSAEDPDDIKVQYDDGVPEPIDYLAESLEKGHILDQWYPSFITPDPSLSKEAIEALKNVYAMMPVPEPEIPDDPDPVEPAEVPAGYTGLHLMLKNKTGKEIAKVYLFPNGEDKGKNIFKTVHDGNIPTEDESVEGKPHEVFAYVFRETAKLGAMTLRVKFADDTEQDIVLEKAVEDYTVFTLKAEEFKQKVSDDAGDMASMDEVAAAGVSTDGVTFEPIQ